MQVYLVSVFVFQQPPVPRLHFPRRQGDADLSTPPHWLFEGNKAALS